MANNMKKDDKVRIKKLITADGQEIPESKYLGLIGQIVKVHPVIKYAEQEVLNYNVLIDGKVWSFIAEELELV